jgi:hypothetical protein
MTPTAKTIIDTYGAADFRAMPRDEQVAVLTHMRDDEVYRLDDVMAGLRFDLEHAETPRDDPDEVYTDAERDTFAAAGADVWCGTCGYLGRLDDFKMPIAHPAEFCALLGDLRSAAG